MPAMTCENCLKCFAQNSIFKCSDIYFLMILCHFHVFLQANQLLRINENLNNVCYKYTFYRK